jgi:hypothetical protein
MLEKLCRLTQSPGVWEIPVAFASKVRADIPRARIHKWILHRRSGTGAKEKVNSDEENRPLDNSIAGLPTPGLPGLPGLPKLPSSQTRRSYKGYDGSRVHCFPLPRIVIILTRFTQPLPRPKGDQVRDHSYF